ncbi:hypothetical protein [Thioclava indica]|uniref:Uncharacterized protein n=1 Tax=Thioclava indica TaxID=1353528 RepID=A0A074JTZ9_9RHOB|nr:hypothetical protein [Thioclava indica]KEO61116.1 hypothetical protein DT23_10295 [Thioclava indica]
MNPSLTLPTVPAMADPFVAMRPSPEALISGPCALPTAPLAMPQQKIEPDLRLSTRLARWLGLGGDDSLRGTT